MYIKQRVEPAVRSGMAINGAHDSVHGSNNGVKAYGYVLFDETPESLHRRRVCCIYVANNSAPMVISTELFLQLHDLLAGQALTKSLECVDSEGDRNLTEVLNFALVVVQLLFHFINRLFSGVGDANNQVLCNREFYCCNLPNSLFTGVFFEVNIHLTPFDFQLGSTVGKTDCWHAVCYSMRFFAECHT